MTTNEPIETMRKLTHWVNGSTGGHSIGIVRTTNSQKTASWSTATPALQTARTRSRSHDGPGRGAGNSLSLIATPSSAALKALVVAAKRHA